MQFLPATWAAYGGGGDINDTHDAIFGAARYLAANGGATDIAHALYRYNHSDHYVPGGDDATPSCIGEHPLALRALLPLGRLVPDRRRRRLPPRRLRIVGDAYARPMVDSAQAVRNLLGEYCERMDLGDWDGVGALFARRRAGRRARHRAGRAARRGRRVLPRRHAAARRQPAHQAPRAEHDPRGRRGRRHRVGAVVVPRAAGASPARRCSRSSPGATAMRSCAHDGEWRFAERRFLVDLVGDLSNHLTFDLR